MPALRRPGSRPAGTPPLAGTPMVSPLKYASASVVSKPADLSRERSSVSESPERCRAEAIADGVMLPEESAALTLSTMLVRGSWPLAVPGMSAQATRRPYHVLDLMTIPPRPIRIGLIHDHFGMDGRSYVVGSIIAALAPLDPSPVVWTLSSAGQVKHFRRWFEQETELSLSLTLRPGPGSPRRGYYLRTLACLTWGRNRGREVDLLVNVTDSAAWCDPTRTLLYICFPIESAPDHDLARARTARRIAGRAVAALHRMASPKRWKAPVLVVSDYTAGFVRKMARYQDVSVTVAAPPPPGVLSGLQIDRRSREIVSVGALMEDKGLEPMVPAVAAAGVAAWRVIGNRADPLVEERLLTLARASGVPITVMPDADTETKRRALDDAAVLFHPKPTEHLGIAVLEGVARGCLPLIAATAGLARHMPHECLFADCEEAGIRLRALLDLGPDARQELHARVRAQLAPLLDRSHFNATVYSAAERILASPASAS